MNWLEHRVGPNPLRFVHKVLTAGEPRRKRRALCADQLRQLVTVSGERAIVYLVAASTGIRRGELALLEWRDVFLDGAQAFIAVRSSVAKNDKHVMQPLPKFVSDKLREVRPPRARSNELVFANGVPRMEVYRKDIAAAGIEYQRRSGALRGFPRVTDDLRHVAYARQQVATNGDGIDAPQRHEADRENVHGCEYAARLRDSRIAAGLLRRGRTFTNSITNCRAGQSKRVPRGPEGCRESSRC